MALVVPIETVKLPEGYEKPPWYRLRSVIELLSERGMIVPLIVDNMVDRVVDRYENWSAQYLCAAMELGWDTVIIDVMDDGED